MHNYDDYTRDRLRQLGERMRTLIHSERRAVGDLTVCGPVDRIPFDEARGLTDFRPAVIGEQFGPLWATFWFRARTRVPLEWAGSRVDLLWASHSEATLWVGGRSVQGLNQEPHYGHRDALLVERARGGEPLEFEVEMACNRLFGEDGHNHPHYPTQSPYVLEQADIARFDAQAWELYQDFIVLQELEAEHERGLDAALDGRLLSELNRFANLFDPADRATWPAAHEVLKALYAANPAVEGHNLSAIGHAHMDTAWLWPLAETARKCVRTFSTVTAHMERYPDYRFACSQAQQYQWIKDHNPDLIGRIRARVKSGQWAPVGGTWIEPDCNIPSGEALARQFLVGQRFFEREMGARCREFWNPDVFGYNGQLPQICNQAGITRFLTQKLHWNRFNKPRHHTFLWEGIDGSRMLTHFPPADTYGSRVGIHELRENVRKYKDHDRSRHSLLLFGYSDGGGGPTADMIERLRRAENLQGLPRVQMRTSDEFFTLLENDMRDPAVVVGELYFEYHRGTYTTQAATKRGNRRGEFMLHDAEFLSAMASRTVKGFDYPAGELERLWRLLLTSQFHDILPGSSVRMVYEEAERDYAEILNCGARLRQDALAALAGGAMVNTIGFARAEVADSPAGRAEFVTAPAYGFGIVSESPDAVSLTGEGGGFILENVHLRACIGGDGSLLSLTEKSTGREALAERGNRLLIYRDEPTAYDAWDVDPYHMETETECPGAHAREVLASGPLRAEVAFDRRIGGASTMRQVVRLDAASRRIEFHCQVDWRERKKMLKVAFPVNVRAMNATYEMQFGSVERPTHFNTLYDLARYEVPGHRWSDLSEHGFGVALLSESKYGFSTFGNVMRMSLLRSPEHPDPNADQGNHAFAYAVMPHAGGWREAGVVAEALRFNVPPVWIDGADGCGGGGAGRESGASAGDGGFLSVDDPNVVLDTVKKAEDTDATVVRLYECHGARGKAGLRVAFPVASARRCNILEDDGEPLEIRSGLVWFDYTPFQVISIKLDA